LSRFGSGVVELTCAVLIILQEHVCRIHPFIITTLDVPAGIVPKLILPGHGWKAKPSSSEYIGFLRMFARLSVKTTL